MPNSFSSSGSAGQYNATPQSLADGSSTPLATDSAGKLLLSTSGLTLSSTVQPNTYAQDGTAIPSSTQAFPIVGRYKSGSTTYSDGSATLPEMDINGNLKVVEQKIPNYEDNTANTAAIFPKPPVGNWSNYGWNLSGGFTGTTYQTTKATQGLVQRISVSNLNAAIRYVLFYNQSTGTPSAATNLIGVGIPIPIGSGSSIPATLIEIPGTYLGVTGITVAISTSPTTFTAATASDHSLLVWYI